MTLYAILAGLFTGAALLARSWWDRRRRAQAEKRAEVATERAEDAEQTVEAAREVAADQVEAHRHEASVIVAADAAAEHPERAAARERVRLRVADETAKRAADRVRKAISGKSRP